MRKPPQGPSVKLLEMLIAEAAASKARWRRPAGSAGLFCYRLVPGFRLTDFSAPCIRAGL